MINDHQTYLEKTYPTGAEEWVCKCGRRVIFQWSPFNRITLEEGDESVTHSGSKNGLEIQGLRLTSLGGHGDSDLDSLRNQINDTLKDLK